MGTSNVGIRNSIRAWWLALALACFPLTGFAFASSSSGNQTTYSGFTANKGNVGKHALTVASDGTILVGSGARHPTPGGGSIPINLSGGIGKPAAAAAVGRFLLRGAAAMTGLLGVGVAAYDLAKELGFTLDNSGGSVVVQKADPVFCTAAPCYQYRGNALANNPWDYSAVAACQRHASTNGRAYLGISGSGQSVYCQQSGGVNFLMLSQAAPVQVPAYTPSTISELEAAIASKSGWPSSSAFPRAVRDAIAAGESLAVGSPTVTGPASSPGPKEVTNKPDGSVVTKQTTNNYTYNTNVVTTTTTTTTTTYNPSTGGTTTETTEAEPEQEEDECAKRPDSLACAEADTPDGEIPRDTEVVSYEEEALFGSGSCPANLTSSIATLGQTVTVWDWQKTCELALPLRALVLSLAAFSALLIVMPGGAQT